jgi:uncharacterized protein YbcI
MKMAGSKAATEKRTPSGDRLILKYSLKTEGGSYPDDVKAWLAAKRQEIFYTLKFKFGALPIGGGLWYMSKNTRKIGDEIQEQIGRWKNEYDGKGIDVNLGVFCVSAIDSALTHFAEEYILQRLGELQRQLAEMLNENDVSAQRVNFIRREVSNIAESITAMHGSSRLALMNDLLTSCKETLFEVVDKSERQ